MIEIVWSDYHPLYPEDFYDATVWQDCPFNKNKEIMWGIPKGKDTLRMTSYVRFKNDNLCSKEW